MTLEEAEAYLSGLGKYGWKLGLERIKALCAAFGHPERRFRSVHVAGSNGKGSTAAMVAAILQDAGFKTGLYVSPYVYTVRERVQINGEMIPEDDFTRLIERIRPVVEELAKNPDVGQPTEFEVKTILGFLYFAEQHCDFAVVEVGLGGRYDATNVLFPEVCVITNISLDHTDRLGHTEAEIAGEKAGIIKEHTPCVTGATGEALKVIAQQCHDCDSSLWRLGQEITTDVNYGMLTVHVGRHTYDHLTLKMKGEHQVRNAALAVGAVDQLIREHVPIPDAAIRAGLARAVLPARFEVRGENPALVLDGAHNPAKAEALANTLLAEYPGRNIHFVYGAVKGHHLSDTMAKLMPLATSVIATQPDDPRALPAEEVAEAARPHLENVQVIPSAPDAVRAALSQAAPEDVVCVTGTFYLMDEVPRS
ncbi:MAG: bifunctional folylpolyglutamate synthase/dihydrofolate synthase [Armatimonadetes bacterium]|nr:bifunctional folylpolyglutamate synthase/dihydrofolate synthase [Armatimonadota bacterium]